MIRSVAANLFSVFHVKCKEINISDQSSGVVVVASLANNRRAIK